MPNTSKEYLQLEKFFANRKLPADIKLEAGVFIQDLPKFVSDNLRSLGTGEMNDVAAAGRYYRMNQLIKLLIAGEDK
jgi:hypothetical protein